MRDSTFGIVFVGIVLVKLALLGLLLYGIWMGAKYVSREGVRPIIMRVWNGSGGNR